MAGPCICGDRYRETKKQGKSKKHTKTRKSCREQSNAVGGCGTKEQGLDEYK